MADRYTKKKRSEVMSKIPSGNTKPEMIVRRYLHSAGLRYALHSKKLPGSPDIVLVSCRVAIFVNGCFWHCHKDCVHSRLPTSNVEFWKNKIATNVLRDIKNYELLNELGYHVLTVWQCELKPNIREDTLCAIVRKIQKYKREF